MSRKLESYRPCLQLGFTNDLDFIFAVANTVLFVLRILLEVYFIGYRAELYTVNE